MVFILEKHCVTFYYEVGFEFITLFVVDKFQVSKS
jgi:hypothetical protein